MATYVNRQVYLQKLINRRDNGEVKIITGTRRCGKSWLLKKVYCDYLVSQGVPNENIISVSFDVDEDVTGEDLTNPMVLKRYLYSKITSEDESYYVFLDEIQMVEGFERIVNGLNAHDNIDVYITGSNSKFFSSDINNIQSAYALPTEEKREQELASLKKIDDSFRKIIIVGDDIATYMDENGYVFMGLFQFLKNEDVME